MNLIQAASLFVKMGVAYHIGVHDALEKACVIVEKEAKRVIGTYDYAWPQLAQSTQETRERLGFEPDDPLLRTGELRDSIEHTVLASSSLFGSHSGHVGSDNQKAVWNELGTSKAPPRSFLMLAAIAKEKEVVHELGEELIVRRLMKP